MNWPKTLRRLRSIWTEVGWTGSQCPFSLCSPSKPPPPGTIVLVPRPRLGRGGGGGTTGLPRLALDGPPRASGGGHSRVPSPHQGGGEGTAAQDHARRRKIGKRSRSHVLNRAHPRIDLVRGHDHHKQRKRLHAPSLQCLRRRKSQSLAQLTEWWKSSLYIQHPHTCTLHSRTRFFFFLSCVVTVTLKCMRFKSTPICRAYPV